ncbi:MAG: sulfatase [Bacteroidota bacterium]
MKLIRSTCVVFLFLLVCFSCGEDHKPDQGETDRPPNVIIILTDDQGYGDLSCYGSPTIHSPHLDQMAAEGLRLTNFYAFPSCSPSRAALLTGCYPPRVGVPDVLAPMGPPWTHDKQYGLHPREETLAELLKKAGYATAMIGKWHLGHFPETMPNRQGFDQYFGLPYSNDMLPERGYPNLPLLRNQDTLELNPNQAELTQRYTEEALNFIRTQKDSSFFLYLAHSMPHVPIFAAEAFAGQSGQGLYADVVQELDASVGKLLDELKALGIDEHTLVIFTSDNGPWLTYGNHAGSAGPFREGKGTTWEGGMRVPMLARWPAKIPAGSVSHYPAALIDLLPTIVQSTGAPLPERAIDGRNLLAYWSSPLHPASAPPETPFCYYRSGKLEALRLGNWKLHLPHSYRYVGAVANDGQEGKYDYKTTKMALYDLAGDPAERYNVVADFPEKVKALKALAYEQQAAMDREKRGPFYGPEQPLTARKVYPND